MSNSKIVLKAGAKAFQLLSSNRLQSSMIAGVAAAAGGPKWFTTYGLVRYIINDLSNDNGPKFFIGSSVGAWQMTAACANEPGAVLDRLRHSYAHYVYNDNPSKTEVSSACRSIITDMLGGLSVEELSSKSKNLYVVTSRGKGLSGQPNKLLLGLGLFSSALTHSIKRSWLDMTMERVVFGTSHDLPYDDPLDELSTTLRSLNDENLIDVLSASGAIPFVMDPVKDISGRRGVYWDGGICDYHMSLPYRVGDKQVVLLPHFSPYVLAGWFDKHLPYIRHANSSIMSNVLVIHPSESYIDSLPRKQISTMQDFNHYGLDQSARISYWNEISERSMELGQEFRRLIEEDRLKDVIIPY